MKAQSQAIGGVFMLLLLVLITVFLIEGIDLLGSMEESMLNTLEEYNNKLRESLEVKDIVYYSELFERISAISFEPSNITGNYYSEGTSLVFMSKNVTNTFIIDFYVTLTFSAGTIFAKILPVFSITSPNNVIVSFYRYNYSSGNWILYETIIPSQENFNLTILFENYFISNEEARYRIVAVSYKESFNITLSEYHIWKYVYDSSSTTILVKNIGDVTLTVVTVWLNNTYYPIEIMIPPGAEANIILNTGVARGSLYIIKVATNRGNVFIREFKVP